MAKHKLRIGLLIDSYDLPFWLFSCIESLLQSDYAEISLIIKNESSLAHNNSLISKFNKLSYSLFKRIENKLYKPKSDAFTQKHLKSVIESCNEIQSDSIHYQELKQLDLIIQLGQNPIPKHLIDHVKFGLWSYYFGDYSNKRNGPIGVWELFEGHNDTKVSLIMQGQHIVKNASIIYETSFSNDKLYTNRHANTISWNASSMLPRMLEELSQSEPKEFFEKWLAKYSEATIEKEQDFKYPNNFQTLKAVFKLYWRALSGTIQRRFYFEQWILLYQLNTNRERPKTFNSFNRMLPPKDRIWADPFVLERNDSVYIFIEEMLFNEPYGKISVIEMDKDGTYKTPKTILEKPYHLSYPFLIEDNGELYMLPETMANNTIELYKCIDFPNKWALEKVIMNNIKAVDSTLLKHDNKYWLFTNIEELNGTKMHSELHVFYSNSLLSDNWKAHQQNPITTDKSCARPAGNMYVTKNRIFRPAQNCTKHYGYAMNIKEITHLDTTSYVERLEQSIIPNWNKDMFSTHTINASKSVTVIDAKINRKR